MQWKRLFSVFVEPGCKGAVCFGKDLMVVRFCFKKRCPFVLLTIALEGVTKMKGFWEPHCFLGRLLLSMANSN